MSSGHLFLLLCVFLIGSAAGLFGPMLGVPPTLAKAIAACAIGAVYLYLEWRGRRARRAQRASAPTGAREPYVSPFEVRFDDTEVVVTRNGEFFERVAWDDLIIVGVHIDDDAFLPQPWWMLFSGGLKHAHYPSEARGGREMLRELQRRLPGFDNAGVIQAMGMMEGGVVVWEASVQQHTDRFSSPERGGP